MALLLMLAIVRDKPGLRAAQPAEAGPLAQGTCCVLHPGESGFNRIAGVTLIRVVWHYCIGKEDYIKKVDKDCIKKICSSRKTNTFLSMTTSFKSSMIVFDPLWILLHFPPAP